MRASFFTPILNASSQEGVRLKSLGDFAERACAWWGNKSYSIISTQKINGKWKIELMETSRAPHLSTAMKIALLTLVFPILMLAVKLAYRLLNNFVLLSPAEIQGKIAKINREAVEKLEQLQKTALTPPLTSQEEEKTEDDLATLCELSRPEVEHLFKNKLPAYQARHPDNQLCLAQAANGQDRFALVLSKLENCASELVKLTQMHSRRLLEKDERGQWKAQQNPTAHKQFQRQIRYLLLYLLKNHPKLSEKQSDYTKHLKASCGNRAFRVLDRKQPCYYFTYLSDKLKDDKDRFVYHLVSFFEDFRRHLCFRLYADKVQKLLEGKDSSETKSLLPITWLHGTHALELIPPSDNTFVPTGWLMQMGVTPLTGELQDGCDVFGINQTSLSGTYLDRSEWAEKYAKEFAFNPQEETRQLNFLFCSSLTNTDDLASHSSTLVRAETAMKRLVRWDQPLFAAQFQQRALDQVHQLQRELAQLEVSNPPDLCRAYYRRKQDIAKNSLAQMESLLANPLPTPLSEVEKSAILNSYPAIVGSDSLVTEPRHADDLYGEHIVRQAAKLGSDLQVLFVPPENRARAEQYLLLHGLQDKVKLYTFKELAEARALNKLVSPYLADIFSSKKLAKLASAA